MTLPEFTHQALMLDPASRARLAHELLSSLDELTDEQRETLWLEEAGRRDQELLSGAAESIPQETVFAKARARRA